MMGGAVLFTQKEVEEINSLKNSCDIIDLSKRGNKKCQCQ